MLTCVNAIVLKAFWLILYLNLGLQAGDRPASFSNLLRDGSFEVAGVPNWNQMMNSGPNSRPTVVDSPIFEGKRALSIQVEGKPDEVRVAQLVQVKSDHHYRMSGYIKTKDVVAAGPGDGGASLSWLGHSKHSQFLKGTNDWTLVEFEFQANEGGEVTVAARLGYPKCPVTGQAWFDDIRLVEIDPPKLHLPRAIELTPEEAAKFRREHVRKNFTRPILTLVCILAGLYSWQRRHKARLQARMQKPTDDHPLA